MLSSKRKKKKKNLPFALCKLQFNHFIVRHPLDELLSINTHSITLKYKIEKNSLTVLQSINMNPTKLACIIQALMTLPNISKAKQVHQDRTGYPLRIHDDGRYTAGLVGNRFYPGYPFVPPQSRSFVAGSPQDRYAYMSNDRYPGSTFVPPYTSRSFVAGSPLDIYAHEQDCSSTSIFSP